MLSDLLEVVYQRDELADLEPSARRLALRELLKEAGVADVAAAVARVADEIDGFGPIARLMEDNETTDILINGPSEVWSAVEGRLSPSTCRFESSEHLRSWCERHVASSG